MTGDVPQCPVCGSQFMFESGVGEHVCPVAYALGRVTGAGTKPAGLAPLPEPKPQTDLALLDQAVRNVRDWGASWDVLFLWKKPVVHEGTIQAIREEYRRLLDRRTEFDRYKFGFNRPEDTGYGVRTVPRFEDSA